MRKVSEAISIQKVISTLKAISTYKVISTQKAIITHKVISIHKVINIGILDMQETAINTTPMKMKRQLDLPSYTKNALLATNMTLIAKH